MDGDDSDAYAKQRDKVRGVLRTKGANYRAALEKIQKNPEKSSATKRKKRKAKTPAA